MDEFINVSLTREARLGELSTKILHGSQTHGRQTAVENLAIDATDFMSSGSPQSGIRLVGKIRNLMKGKYPEELTEELTTLLLEDNPKMFADKMGKVLKPEDFAQMRQIFTTTGTVIGAEQATRATQ